MASHRKSRRNSRGKTQWKIKPGSAVVPCKTWSVLALTAVSGICFLMTFACLAPDSPRLLMSMLHAFLFSKSAIRTSSVSAAHAVQRAWPRRQELGLTIVQFKVNAQWLVVQNYHRSRGRDIGSASTLCSAAATGLRESALPVTARF